MAKRATFLVQILDKIGAPLLAAIEGFRDEETQDSEVQQAQTVAALLAKAVQMSVQLSQNMDLSGSEEDADSVRLGLAALVGPILAETYKATQKIPDDADMTRITKALEAVLSFSDNFAPSKTHIARLQSLEDNQVHSDEDQNTIYVMQALLPVVDAVAEFPFGQAETALVQQIAGKLQEDARILTEAILRQDEVDNAKAKYVELMALRSLAKVYAECHKAQTKKLIAAGGDATPSLDPVWQNYDIKRGMLETIAGSVLPGGAQGIVSSSAGAGVAPQSIQEPQQQPLQQVEQSYTPPPPPPQQQPVQEQAPQPQVQAAPVQQPAPPPAQQPDQQPAAQSGAPQEGNPMAFFGKKPEAQPQSATPQPMAPPPPPPPAPPPPPVQQQPPIQQPAQSAPPADGNPMAFFKKKQDDSGNA